MSAATNDSTCRRRRAPLVASAVVGLLVVATGCATGSAGADRVIAAAERLERTGVTGTVTFKSARIPEPDEDPVAAATALAARPPALAGNIGPLPVAIAAGPGLPTAAIGTDDPATLFSVYDRSDIYVQVPPAKKVLAGAAPSLTSIGLGGGGALGPQPAAPVAPPTAVPPAAVGVPLPKPWVRMSLTTIPPRYPVRRVGEALPASHPAYLARLARGALAGSVVTIGREDLGGAPADHFRVNIDRHKAADGLSEYEAQDQDRALQVAGATALVFPAEVWVASDGSLRRMVLRIPEERSARERYTLEITFDLAQGPGSAPAAIVVPKDDDVVDVSGYPDLLSRLETQR